ncbi:SMODS-associated NUDIX domain-containing protein [Aequorivita echinoideorum]|jgi:hypothetical protein|uniref:SMODS-associated NUDIX domain-containing protein n=1 Tax=Aequorivita echinoideorum TaxID=1549647 RepID=UPI001BDA4DB1|nr:hypothetical protein [Aequorivita echinoideorum]|tara:strand:+ start:2066 stop:2893 length:828 start_codon:yes stop_codon:yes gene_type:complete
MSSELKRFFGYVVGFCLAIGYLIYRYFFLNPVTDFHKEILVAFAIAIITACLMGIYETIKCQGKYFWIALKCSLLIPNKKVYVSLSYLLRIKIQGNELYFLVKGSKINQYQPVGGVYKLVGNKDIYKDWEAYPKSDIKNPKDLRFFVRAKHIPNIIQWFKSRKDREIGVWREFFEELVETKILKPENFKTIRAEYLGTHENILNKQNRFSDETYHTLIYDIFQIELNQDQLNQFNNLLDANRFTEKYAFVTKDEIEKECFNNHKFKIGQHAKFTI